MTENPYEILGVSKNASLDDIKKAYRKKARENHPDLHPNDPVAEERMNKINEAYDRITNPEKYVASDARKEGAAGGTSPSADGFDWSGVNVDDMFNGAWAGTAGIHPETNARDSAEIKQAVAAINAAEFDQAIDILQKIPSTGRNARWYYLFAIANFGNDNIIAANDNIRRARELDPKNQDYLYTQAQFVQQARDYQKQGERRGFSQFGIDQNWLCCCICLAPTCAAYFGRMCMGV